MVRFQTALVVAMGSFLLQSAVAEEGCPLVIAHRGASGYLPEHTLPSKAMAYAMGADYLEQDVVLTRDGIPVVLHDIHVDTVTDAAKRFPDRARSDGRFYAIDFTLAEIKTLAVTERFAIASGKAVHPGRFPVGKSSFTVPTLAEEIELIQGLNKSTGRTVGIYPEIKSPAWHRAEGHDISPVVLKVLRQYGYHDRQSPCYLQCFDAGELKRLRNELGVKLRLVQLIGENAWKESGTDYDRLKTAKGLAEVAQYADGIGPSLSQVIAVGSDKRTPVVTDLVRQAHAVGLVVHPYTLRADALPRYATTFDELLRWFCVTADVDGLFTDFPDRAAAFVRTLHGRSQ